MSLRGIRIYGDPVLGSRAEEVSTFDRGLRILANDMLETMDEAGGVGLAANQVGILKRILSMTARIPNLACVARLLIPSGRSWARSSK